MGRRFWREETRWKGHAKQERKIKEEKKSFFSSFLSLLPLTSVCLARARAREHARPFFVPLDCHPRATRLHAAECRWKLHGNKPSAFFNRRRKHRAHPAGAHTCAMRLNVNGCPRYDIYFIDVSLPSSMIIYNCCPRAPNCNYYNYIFFVRALSESGPGPGPGPGCPLRSIPLDAAPPLWSFVSRGLLPFPLHTFLSLSFRLSLDLAPSFSISLARCSFYLANRDQIYGGSAVETGFGSWTRASRLLAFDS